MFSIGQSLAEYGWGLLTRNRTRWVNYWNVKWLQILTNTEHGIVGASRFVSCRQFWQMWLSDSAGKWVGSKFGTNVSWCVNRHRTQLRCHPTYLGTNLGTGECTFPGHHQTCYRCQSAYLSAPNLAQASPDILFGTEINACIWNYISVRILAPMGAEFSFGTKFGTYANICTVEAGYTAGIWGHHEHPRHKLTLL
jgi:hypothetical protein